MEERYKKSDVAGFRGFLYQAKLLTLFHVRGLQLDHRFRLATEVVEAEKLDDIVYEYRRKGGGEGSRYRLVQAKHKKSGTAVGYRELFGTWDKDFSLNKYLYSLCSIKRRGGLGEGGRIEEVAVITTASLDLESLERNRVVAREVSTSDHIMEGFLCYGLDGETLRDVLRREIARARPLCPNVRPLAKNGVAPLSFWDELSDEDIDDFCGKFRLYVEVGYEGKLDSAVKEGLTEYTRLDFDCVENLYDSLLQEIIVWFENREGRFLSDRDVGKIGNRLFTLVVNGMTRCQSGKMSGLGVKFEKANAEIETFLKYDERKVSVLPALDPLVTSIQIEQTLHDCLSFSKEKNRIIVELSSLYCQNALTTLSRCIQLSGSLKVVVMLVEEGDEVILKKFLQEIFSRESKDVDTKAVLIVQETAVRSSLNVVEELGLHFSLQKCHRPELHDFDFQSQQKILNRQVKFQGETVSIGVLVGDEGNGLLDSDSVVKLIHGKELTVGKECSFSGDLKRFYINRRFKYNYVVNEWIFKQNDRFRVAVVGVSRMYLFEFLDVELSSSVLFEQVPIKGLRRIIVLDGSRYEEQFAKLCELCSDVYLLEPLDKFLPSSFQVIKAHGEIDDLRKYKYETDKAVFTEEEMMRMNKKAILISDKAGMGKSTVLRNLACNLKKENPEKWVLLIDLKACTEVFLAEMNFLILKIDHYRTVIDCLIKLAKHVGKIDWEERLLERGLNEEGRVIIMLDGLDEISPDYTVLALNLCKGILGCGKQTIWLSTRPHVRKEMESRLGVLSYSLQPLTSAEQKEFLCKYWEKGGRSEVEAEKILKVLEEGIGKEGKVFPGTPLHARMLADVYRDPLESLPQRINISDLYERFIDTKIELYMKEKLSIDFSNPGMKILVEEQKLLIRKTHFRVGFATLFPKEYKDFERGFLSLKKGEIDYTRIGLIVGFVDGRPLWVHRTFAEFFAAGFITNKLELYEDENYSNIVNLFFKTVLSNYIGYMKVSTDYKVVAQFVEHFISRVRLDNKLVDKFAFYSQNNIFKSEYDPLLLCSHWYNISHFLLKCYTREPSKSRRKQGDYRLQLLHHAAYLGNAEIVEDLIKQNEDINVCDYQGNTALYHAAMEGHCTVGSLLLRNGINPNTGLISPLQVAIQRGHKDFVSLLLDWKVDVKMFYEKSHTFNLWNGINFDIIILMLEKGGRIDGKNVFSILERVAREKRWSELRNIAEKTKEKVAQNGETNEILQSAVVTGDVETVEFLLGLGFDVNARDWMGSSPLYYSARDGFLEVTRLLMEKGAKVNSDDESPLWAAATRGHYEVVDLLLENGANPNTEWSGNAILYVAEKGYWNLFLRLTEAGVRTGKPKRGEYTALMYAIAARRADVVDALVAEEDPPDLRGEYGSGAVTVASKTGDWELVRRLLERGVRPDADLDKVLVQAVEAAQLGIVALLLGEGSDSREGRALTALAAAAGKGMEDAVRALLDGGADPSAVDYFGRTALHCAVLGGHRDVVRLLLKKGNSVNLGDCMGDTPISYALYPLNKIILKILVKMGEWDTSVRGFPSGGEKREFGLWDRRIKVLGSRLVKYCARISLWDIVELLLDRAHEEGLRDLFLEVNLRTSWEPTLLSQAAHAGKRKIVQRLLENEVDVNCVNSMENNRTALITTAKAGHWDVVELLLEKGADVNIADCEGNTALHYVAGHGRWGLLERFLERGALVNVPNSLGETVHFYSVSKGSLEVTKILAGISDKDDIDVEYKGRQAIHYACSFGREDIVRFLLEMNASISGVDTFGNTPLHTAAEFGNLSIVRRLVEKGADIGCLNRHGESVLHRANIYFDIVEYLLDNGVDPNSSNDDGSTALFGSSIEVVRLLLARGANVNAVNRHGTSALHWAAGSDQFEVCDLLLKNGSSVNASCDSLFQSSPLYTAVNNGHWRVAMLLIENGADIRFRPGDYYPLLHLAAKYGKTEFVEFLINMREDVNAVSKFGNTALQVAVESGKARVVSILLDNGADVEASDTGGRTALHYAASQIDSRITDLLLEKGADVNSVDFNGNTPLHLAAHSQNLQVVKLLLCKNVSITALNRENKMPTDLAWGDIRNLLNEWS